MQDDFEDFNDDAQTAVFFANGGRRRRAVAILGAACRRYGHSREGAASECRGTLGREPCHHFWAHFDGDVMLENLS